MRRGLRSALGFTTSIVAAALWGACGGATTVNLGGGDAGSDGGSGSGGSSGGGSGSGSGSSGGGSGSSSGSGSGSSSGSSGGSGSSSGSSSGGSSGSSGGSSSGGSSGSSSGGTTFACPATPCSPGTVCCTQPGAMSIACSPACQSADTLECLQPGDCTSGVCCETVVLNGGMAPNCQVQSLSSTCANDCATLLRPNCVGTDTLHICAQASDCQNDTANPNCCQVAGQLVCVGDTLATNLQCQ